VGLNSLKSLNLTNVYPNKNKNKNKKNNKVKSKPLELRSRVKMHGPASDRKEGQTCVVLVLTLVVTPALDPGISIHKHNFLD
jgi:hypothetical protein